MRLADFKDDAALELVENILDPLAVLTEDSIFMAMVRARKPKLLLARHVIKFHKKEVVEIIAAMHGETPETVHYTLPSLIKDVMDIINDPDLDVVFSLPGQMTGGASSTSVPENTEE